MINAIDSSDDHLIRVSGIENYEMGVIDYSEFDYSEEGVQTDESDADTRRDEE